MADSRPLKLGATESSLAEITNMDAVGFLRFKPGLVIDGVSLGGSLGVKIGGVALTLEFPVGPPGDSDMPAFLLAPEGLRTHREALQTPWGDAVAWSAKEGISAARIDYAALRVARAHAVAIADAHLDWLDRFTAFVRLLTKQETLYVVRISRASNPMVRFYSPDDRGYHIGPPANVSATVIGRKYGHPASMADMEKASQWASSGKRPPLCYLLLLSACDAFRKGENRTAVIEATTALEVAITTKVRKHLLANQAQSDHAEWLLEGYDGLQKKLSILRKVFGPTTITPPDKYAQFRNRVAHGGQPAGLEEAKAHIVSTWDMISRLIPDVAEDP